MRLKPRGDKNSAHNTSHHRWIQKEGANFYRDFSYSYIEVVYGFILLGLGPSKRKGSLETNRHLSVEGDANSRI